MINLVYVGRISPEKGICSLADKLLSKHAGSIDVRFHIFGEASSGCAAKILDYPPELVVCYGWVDNPWDLICSLSHPISVNYSRFEAMGFSILESMQNSVPVIATPTQGATVFLAEIPSLLFTSLDPPLVEIVSVLLDVSSNYGSYADRVGNLSGKYSMIDRSSLASWIDLLAR